MVESEQPKRTLKLKYKSLPILVGILLLVQLIWANRIWMVLLSGLSGAWLLSYLWARSLRDGLRFERELRFGWMQVGDRLQENIQVENQGWAPALWVRVIDPSEMGGYDINTVAEVRGHWSRSWYSRGICQRRGVFTLGPTSLETGDPFGLYQVRVANSDTVDMMVAPQVIDLPEVEIAAGGRIGGIHSSSRGLEQTVSAAGVREYSPGNSMRWVHWPTTARMNEIYVHVYDNEPSSDWWVILDMDPSVQAGEGQISTEEYSVILAASIVNQGLQLNKSVGLVSQGKELAWHPPESGEAQLWKVIHSLAELRLGGPSLESVLSRVKNSIDPHTSLVIITPNLSLTWIRALEMIKAAGIVPTVILLDANTFGGSGDLQVMRDHLYQLEVMHYVFTADFLVPIEKEKDRARDWWLLYRERKLEKKPKSWFGSGIRQQIRNLGLLLLTFWGLIHAIGNGIRGVENSLLWFLVISGMLTGWLFTRTPLTAWLFIPINILVGLVFSLNLVGGLTGGLKTAGSYFLQLLNGGLRWIFRAAPKPDSAQFLASLREIWTSLTLLIERLSSWVTGLVHGEPYFDPIMVALFWGLMVWLVATWAMWGIFKLKRPLLGLSPAVLLAAITLSSLAQFSYSLVLMTGTIALLALYMTHDFREESWEEKKLYSDASIQPRVLTFGIGLAVGLMVFSFLFSWISFKPLTEIFHELRTERIRNDGTARSFGLEPQRDTRTDEIASLMNGGLPNDHLVGAGPQLSDQVVLHLTIEGISQDVIYADRLVPLRYIRNLTYDRYTGSGWVSRSADVREYRPGEQLFPEIGDSQLVLRQSVTLSEEIRGTLFTIGTPLSVDQDFAIAWRLGLDEEGDFDLFGGVLEAESYRADSILPKFDEEDLRNAGQTYPDWIQERFLPLPASVPERVLTLARDLTATEPNPYDRAIAIESYLRGFEYTLDVPNPPRDQDITDYFLFSLQKGYCDYFATAMVVLSRAAGIPARLVTGYLAETYNDAEHAYVVTADQAHSWVEIYFPKYGWVPFEPTAGRPAITRQQSSVQPEMPELDLALEPLIKKTSDKLIGWARWAGVVLLSILSLGLVGAAGYEAYFIRRPVPQLLPAIFGRIYWIGERIGVYSTPGDTAYEYFARFKDQMELLPRSKRLKDWMKDGSQALGILADAYQSHLFRKAGAGGEAKQVVINAYRYILPKLLVLWGISKARQIPLTRFLFRKKLPAENEMIRGRVR